MIIIGVDYHPSDQYLALVDTETGEYEERQLNHSEGEAEKFYRELAAPGVQRGRGAGGHRLCRLVRAVTGRAGIEVWIGDAAQIKTERVREPKTTGRTPDCYCDCCGKIIFRASGYPVRRIGTCDNCCGTGIGSCRCARGS